MSNIQIALKYSLSRVKFDILAYRFNNFSPVTLPLFYYENALIGS